MIKSPQIRIVRSCKRMSKCRHEVVCPTNKFVCRDRRWKRKSPSRSLRLRTTETRSAGSTGAVLLPGAWSPVGRLGCRRSGRGGRWSPVVLLGCRRSGRGGRWSQGCFPGVLLEFNKLATLSRVDGENHALLAMTSLLAVEPHRVCVFHSEVCPREGLLVFCHWHTDRTNQNSSWTQWRTRDLQASVESARKGRTRGFKRGLCHCVVLLLEDERDDIAGVGRLVMMACPEAHDGKSYGPRTTKEGLYWISPSGPPATTSISAALAGRAARRPSKVESVTSLENITSVS